MESDQVDLGDFIRNIGGRFVDSQRFPKLGYVPVTPDVTIAKLRTVVIERRPPSEPWSFVIYLTERDSLAIESFTRTNVSRSVLISVCGQPVAAPVLLSSIDTGSFVFDCADRVVAERLERELTQMATEKGYGETAKP